ncbi:MAG TPA: DNA cytosine methyltransferase [Porticoccus sp.]|nr:DNA cytosine methyltransferase [Porticoccus sp.]
MKAVDLFAGCGGMSLGFESAGIEILAAFENWGPAIETYEANFKHPIFSIDLSQEERAIELIAPYAPDLIIGGPPCQDFSIAGRGVESERANLTLSFARIVAAIKPQIVVMENVYNIEKSQSLPQALEILESAGYGITKKILDASLTGVPQKRRRFFLVGELGQKKDFYDEALDSKLADQSMTVHDYFGTTLDTQYYYAHPRNYKRRAVFSIHEPSSTIRRVNRPIPSTYKSHPADKSPINSSVRPLTTKERSMIQSFPPSFVFQGTKSQQEQQIGNAVPVKLAEYVASRILDGRNYVECEKRLEASI